MKVLVADDNANVRQAVRHVLTNDFGAEVREAVDGLEVLQVLAESPCDLLVLDIEMEPLGGVETLQAIRRVDDWRTLPVVVMSGSATPDAVKSVKALGVDVFLVKPLSLALLRDRLVPIVQHLAEAPTRRSGRKAHVPLALKPATHVWLVGEEEAGWGDLRAHLSTVCRATHWPDAIRAARHASALKPDIVFVSAGDAGILSPGLFARAVRRERPSVALVLSGAVESCEREERELFDAEMPFSHPLLLNETLQALGPIVTEASLGLVALRTDPAVAMSVCEAVRVSLSSALGMPVEMQSGASATRPDESAMEAWVPLSIGEATWIVRVVMPSRLVVRRATALIGDEGLVTHAAALACAMEDASGAGAAVADALIAYGIHSTVGAASSRVLPAMELSSRHMAGRANQWQAAAGDEVVALASLETPELRTPLPRVGEVVRRVG